MLTTLLIIPAFIGSVGSRDRKLGLGVFGPLALQGMLERGHSPAQG